MWVLIPGLERSPGVENGNPFQYSCLGQGTWQATVYGIAESDMTECTHVHAHAYMHTHTHTHTRTHLKILISGNSNGCLLEESELPPSFSIETFMKMHICMQHH